MSVRRLPIIELFGPTIQGEGAMCGIPTHFLRLAGCGYRCTWCDSMHAVEVAEIRERRTLMIPDEIVKRLNNLPTTQWVTLTGGDPCIHHLLPLVEELHRNAFRIAVETQGQFWSDWLLECNHVTISPKGPSSGMETNWDALDYILNNLFHYTRNTLTSCIKVVVFDLEDLEYAKQVAHRYDEHQDRIPLYLSVGTPIPANRPIGDLRFLVCTRLKWLLEEVIRDRYLRNRIKAVLPQMHVLAWGDELER